MTDPFDVLYTPITAADPDPAFATELRSRLERALNLPRGVAVTSVSAPTASGPTASAPTASAPPAATAIPYLALRDAHSAIDWYRDVFDAELIDEPIVMPDGRIGHAELLIAGNVFYLSDESPDLGHAAPQPGAASVSFMLPVADADVVRDRAVTAGADGSREPYDGYGSRTAWVVDPVGHRWGLQSPLAPTPTMRTGDVGYVSIWVPDVDRAADFYASVLDWGYSSVYADGRHVADRATPSVGIYRSADGPTLFCCYAVDDVAAAVERIRAAGGEAGEPTVEPFGLAADCLDDQGTRFSVYQFEPGAARPPADGNNPGNLAYLTLLVVDSVRARAFYGSVLGWSFVPGRIEDGWQVQDVAPMTGLSGGHDRAAGVPMWQVEDIATAVARVRSAGGTATDPERQPYGISAECTDNQGTHFYLGQL
jgi:predicted enzyme related to lactoylglutathione lyase